MGKFQVIRKFSGEVNVKNSQNQWWQKTIVTIPAAAAAAATAAADVVGGAGSAGGDCLLELAGGRSPPPGGAGELRGVNSDVLTAPTEVGVWEPPLVEALLEVSMLLDDSAPMTFLLRHIAILCSSGSHQAGDRLASVQQLFEDILFLLETKLL